LVGASLGGQLAGLTGKSIKRKTINERVLTRISALDPAAPLFFPTGPNRHVSKDDAEFVKLINLNFFHSIK
jgi:hypothetical protein